MANADHGLRGFMEYQIPFCKPFICTDLNQSNESLPDSNEVILWDCMPHECRNNIITFVTVVLIVAFITVTSNVAVLVINLSRSSRRIFRRNRTMQNYANYVISLSLADCLTGGLVLPLAVAFFFTETLSSQPITSVSNSSLVSPQPLREKNLLVAEPYRTDSTPFINCLGFFIYFCVFVSMYTLAAASIDRYSVSRKANCKPLYNINKSSSLRRCNSERLRSFFISLPSRSGTTVVAVWLMGALLSITPFAIVNNSYQQVGHMFVIVCFDVPVLNVLWYLIFLVIPFSVIWIFSGLLWFALRKRKKKMKICSKTLLTQDASDKRTDGKEFESSCVMVTRYSNADSPVVFRVNSASSQDTGLESKNISHDNPVKAESSSRTLERPQTLNLTVNFLAPPASKQLSFLEKTRLANPLIQDTVYEKAGVTFVTASSRSERREYVHKTRKVTKFPKFHSFDGVPASAVAQKILIKSNRESASCNEPSIPSIQLSTPFISRRNDSSQLSSTSTSPTPSSPVGVRHGDILRNSSNRSRRRSSIFRAKEFMMSNSFESNVAKSLLMVVFTLSFSVLPTLIAFTHISFGQGLSKTIINNNSTTAVVVIVILLSNSLWNCLIYGAKTRYFRAAVRKTLNRVLSYQQNIF